MFVNYTKIRHPAAWKATDIGGKEGLIHRLSDEQVAALEGLATRNAHKPPEAITRADFTDPAIDALMMHVRDTIMGGRGAIVLHHPRLIDRPLDEYSRIYWGLGTHLGRGVVQSAKLDHIGRVEKVADNPTGRGYMLDIELRPHTDFHELLSLASIRTAASGGESGVASSLAIHNIMLEERPDLLAALYEGFFHERVADKNLSPEKVPVFCNIDGVVSCYFHPMFIWAAAKKMNVSLPGFLDEALRYFSDVSVRPDVRAFFTLEPGEMLFWHNFIALHSRESFHNEGQRQRLLLRLWLHADEGRPMHPTFTDTAFAMDHIHESGRPAIDYVRTGTLAQLRDTVAKQKREPAH